MNLSSCSELGQLNVLLWFRTANITNSQRNFNHPLYYKYKRRMKLYGKPLIHTGLFKWSTMTQIHNKMVCTAGSGKIEVRTSISRTSNHKHETD
jgi:hypothetical protein